MINQIIILTSEKSYHCLNPFMWLFDKYFLHGNRAYRGMFDMVVCAFRKPMGVAYDSYGWRWHTIGEQSDYPINRWSDKLHHVLENVANEQFILMLEDYWIYRHVDLNAINLLYGYMRRRPEILKIDLAFDRLYVDGHSPYMYGRNTAVNVSYLDLVESPPGAEYQMSLWGGIWNRDMMKRFLVPGEKAQEVEIFGTPRVNAAYSETAVYGTRQGPLLHTNVYSSGRGSEPDYSEIRPEDLEVFRGQRWI